MSLWLAVAGYKQSFEHLFGRTKENIFGFSSVIHSTDINSNFAQTNFPSTQELRQREEQKWILNPCPCIDAIDLKFIFYWNRTLFRAPPINHRSSWVFVFGWHALFVWIEITPVRMQSMSVGVFVYALKMASSKLMKRREVGKKYIQIRCMNRIFQLQTGTFFYCN